MYGGFGAQSIGAPIGALVGAPIGALVGTPVAIRRADRDSARRSRFGALIAIWRTEWTFSNLACIWVVQMCLKLNMHVLYMYVCTLFGALVGAPIAIRRTDRDSARRSRFGTPIAIRHTEWTFSNLACIWVVQMCLRLNMHLLYMYVCIYTIFGTLFGALGGIDVSPG